MATSALRSRDKAGTEWYGGASSSQHERLSSIRSGPATRPVCLVGGAFTRAGLRRAPLRSRHAERLAGPRRICQKREPGLRCDAGCCSIARRATNGRRPGEKLLSTLATTHNGDPEVPVISLENVHKRFGSFVAVERANFEIRRGEFFSMLGPSGCGKTTMLRMIAGFEEVSAGRIRLDGVDVSTVPPYRRNVNTVFQQYALFPHLNVFDNVAFGPRSKGIAEAEVKRRIGEMLEVVRLQDYATRRPDQLSGGQRQRVALARALVNFPSALLLDEPLSALDLKLRQAMQLELKRIQREIGIAFVFVTHDQEEALTMSDRTAVMSEGRVEQVGTPEEIYHSPATVFVAGFIGTANLIPVRVVRSASARAEVELAGGQQAQVPATAGTFSSGDRAVVMVRPERVKLSAQRPENGGRWCTVPVTVTEIIFQGPVLRCLLRDSAGDELTAHIDGAERPPGLAHGAAMWAVWDTAAVRLLPPRAQG
ncbi:MAG: ABC transporter ATP-binding protein [Deltaproteobacteria bacterium]|nr:ABC transporter ATP-binding protein [Deltaproteobacteria bacterium]